MDEGMMAEYCEALSQVVLARGTLVHEDPSIYMWEDDDAYNDCPHLSECRVVHYGDPVEVQWDEFLGTDITPATHHGVDLPGVHCACGRVTDRTVRLNMPVPEMLREMFSRLYRALT